MTAYTMHAADPTDIKGKRIGAWIIDLVIYLIFAFAISAAFGGAKSESYSTSSKESADSYCTAWRLDHSGTCFTFGSGTDYTSYTIQDGGRSLAIWGLHLIIYAAIQGSTGASLGKMAVGLRVVDAEGNKAGMGKSFLRTILWIADAVTCAVPIVGGILMVSTKGHRRLGDMAAGTYVVEASQMGHPLSIPGLTSGYGTPGYGTPGYGVPGTPAPAGWGGPQAGAPGMGGPAYGPPSSPVPGSWSPPGSTDPAAAAPGAAASGDAPQWDAARNTYIQYDRAQSAWMQWDAASSTWVPISQ